MNIYEQLNGVTLAYLGDAVYEVYIRKYLLSKGITKVNALQKNATSYVSAKAQAALIMIMEEESVLTDNEMSVYKRGRNAKVYTKAKNTSIATYHMSTGFEAVFGYLSLMEENQRLDELAKWCIEKVEAGQTHEKRIQ
ncbi:mini-ribonuclease 3 [Companilactobacillus sp. RD055328]|uniref:Mini-ribonuclease 3 n=1 Tax=Companilactobacillus sp. RD055328 TaxID=2916634 RepID=UPI001FC8B62A|nr:ribonuclease III domain-containing protein [Companilactobacillus sp. RD055328]GKQ42173.1 mini-ribonuclease 3 [Companilactobacillus sp. RD055328]